MVLTRAAAKSILRWLPNELLTAVMCHLFRADLVALCRTSRLLRNLATPLLYRSVYLSNNVRIQHFVRTMTQSSTSSLSIHVRRFLIADEDENLRLTPTLVESITSICSKFIFLELLDLFLVEPIEFTDLLRDAHFPRLTTFQYTVQSSTASLIPAFLNRHPTIIDLGLTRSERFDEMDPINLPNLKNYEGPSSFVRAFGPETCSIDSAVLLWYPDDSDIEAPLLHLGSLSSLSSISAVSVSNSFQPTAVMGSLVRHLPNLRIIKFRTLTHGAGPISREDALEIATHLEKMSFLVSLEITGDDDDSTVRNDVSRDDETVRLWGGACKTLSTITLNAGSWMSEPGSGYWRVPEVSVDQRYKSSPNGSRASMASSPPLPLDLLRPILSHITENQHLLALCRVSKTFSHEAQPLLFIDVTLASCFVAAFCRALVLFPTRALLVQRLAIQLANDFPEARMTALGRMLRSLENLRELEITPPQPAAWTDVLVRTRESMLQPWAHVDAAYVLLGCPFRLRLFSSGFRMSHPAFLGFLNVQDQLEELRSFDTTAEVLTLPARMLPQLRKFNSALPRLQFEEADRVLRAHVLQQERMDVMIQIGTDYRFSRVH
ncbi:hypothetical protein MSAN_01603200 [Mycena sanguinolenta]|uniref:F-box domain-containing protein n=1 Tax=Mycena sanguinolenta TaxID=230812 RepID=A0A8H7CXL7_9AGAR|nr:hypothetical protein MSAN_01603200 [Mycena sanguinolenta]